MPCFLLFAWPENAKSALEVLQRSAHKQKRHIYDSQGLILALPFMQKFLFWGWVSSSLASGLDMAPAQQPQILKRIGREPGFWSQLN
jgi:hypothetical protein